MAQLPIPSGRFKFSCRSSDICNLNDSLRRFVCIINQEADEVIQLVVCGREKCGISIRMIYGSLKGHSLTVAVNYATRIYLLCYWNTLSKLLNCLCVKLCSSRFPFANTVFSPCLLCYMGERPANTSSSPHLNIKTCSLMEGWGSWRNVGCPKTNWVGRLWILR
jgi:hypothetical protein